jgi:hypothetical protein
MAKAPAANRGLTPGKLGLIIVLAIVFLVVIVIQFGGPDKSTGVAARKSKADAPAESASSREQTTSAEQPSNLWPAYEVDDLLNHNPFSLPQELQPPEAPEIAETREDVPVESRIRGLRRRQADLMASLREQGVDMVLVTPHGRVARVGPTTFREGDLVEGLVVKEISAAGIIFVQELTSGQP